MMIIDIKETLKHDDEQRHATVAGKGDPPVAGTQQPDTTYLSAPVLDVIQPASTTTSEKSPEANVSDYVQNKCTNELSLRQNSGLTLDVDSSNSIRNQ